MSKRLRRICADPEEVTVTDGTAWSGHNTVRMLQFWRPSRLNFEKTRAAEHGLITQVIANVARGKLFSVSFRGCLGPAEVREWLLALRECIRVLEVDWLEGEPYPGQREKSLPVLERLQTFVIHLHQERHSWSLDWLLDWLRPYLTFARSIHVATADDEHAAYHILSDYSSKVTKLAVTSDDQPDYLTVSVREAILVHQPPTFTYPRWDKVPSGVIAITCRIESFDEFDFDSVVAGVNDPIWCPDLRQIRFISFPGQPRLLLGLMAQEKDMQDMLALRNTCIERYVEILVDSMPIV